MNSKGKIGSEPSLSDLAQGSEACATRPLTADQRWKLRLEVAAAKARLSTLKSQLHEADAEFLRGKTRRLGPQQQTVLDALSDGFYSNNEWQAYTLKRLVSDTGLTTEQCRRACRALRRLGLAAHELNLWTEDGEMVGAGYRMTEIGRDWLNGCVAQPTDLSTRSDSDGSDTNPSRGQE